MRVIIFGATGMAGSGVLEACLEHPEVLAITSVGRRSTGIEHAKLTEIIHDDFLDYSAIESELRGHDACFWCLGVSSATVRDEETYHVITHDYTMAAAKTLAALNPELTFCFLTGMGTEPTMKSRFMWARVKGKTETSLESVLAGRAYMFRPGFIFPLGGSKRYAVFARILRPIYPLLYKLFPNLVTIPGNSV
ncbi:NAD-dependent epimerase/dehydratase family protein [Candidatus Neomarinimicrobiota bacterium]